MLRFRRVFNNIMEFNGLYDIYIDSDLQLLLYGNEQTRFISVTDTTGTPVNIPVYRFTGMEPYDLPQKQPTPFPYFSPEDVSRNMELNDLLTGDKKLPEAANDWVFTNDTTPENSKNAEKSKKEKTEKQTAADEHSSSMIISGQGDIQGNSIY